MESGEELFVLKRYNLNMEGIKIPAGHAAAPREQLTAEGDGRSPQQTTAEYKDSIVLRKRRVESPLKLTLTALRGGEEVKLYQYIIAQ